jgi:hypothetical protein
MKVANINAPRYGPADSHQALCFNFCTDPSRRCTGLRAARGNPWPTCTRLHLDFNDPTYRNAPKEHYADIHAWLQHASVRAHFLPSDVFASSTQFRAL